MTTRVMYVQPDQRIEECMALMTEKRIRHLPIIEHERVLCIDKRELLSGSRIERVEDILKRLKPL